MFTSIGRALDAFSDYRPAMWAGGRTPSQLRQKRATRAQPRKGIDLFAFLSRAAGATAIAAAVAAPAGHALALGQSIHTVAQPLTIRASPFASSSRAQIEASAATHPVSFHLQAASSEVTSSILRVGGLRPLASPQVVDELTAEESELAYALSAPLARLGIQPLLVFHGNSQELILEAGRPSRTLTLICTQDRFVAMFRLTETEAKMQIQEFEVRPTAKQLTELGKTYLATEWLETT